MVELRLAHKPRICEFLAEFLGTLTLVCIGCSINVVSYFDLCLPVPFGWGLALIISIYISGGVSGGHLNPAVTLGMASIGKFKWNRLVYYFAGQYLGAFIGSLFTFIIYQESLTNIPHNISVEMFGTRMREDITLGTAIIDQIIATALFLIIICAILDEKNVAIPKGLAPMAIGLGFIALQCAFSYNCGGPLNPARDLGPRIFSVMAGWSDEAFKNTNAKYFWVPIVACHVGAIIGCWLYKLLIENHLPNESYDFRDENGLQEMDGKKPHAIRVTKT